MRKTAEQWAAEAEIHVREKMAGVIANIVQRAIEAEREECAKVAEDFAVFAVDQVKGPIQKESAELIAREIRERPKRVVVYRESS